MPAKGQWQHQGDIKKYDSDLGPAISHRCVQMANGTGPVIGDGRIQRRVKMFEAILSAAAASHVAAVIGQQVSYRPGNVRRILNETDDARYIVGTLLMPATFVDVIDPPDSVDVQ